MVLVLLMPSAWTVGLPIFNSNFPADDLFVWVYQNKVGTIALACALLISGAWLSNTIFNRHEFFNVPSYVLAIIYAGLGSAISLYQCSLPALIASLFILLGLNKQMQVFKQSKVLSEYFECGFWYGMAAIFFPPFVFLILGLWLTVLFMRSFKWREHILPIVAFSVPFIYWIVWKYWKDEMNDLVLFRSISSFDPIGLQMVVTWPQRIFFSLVAIAFVMALPRYLFLGDRASNKARGVKNIFSIMALSIVLAFVLGYLFFSKFILLALLIPLTFIIGYWFTNYRYSLAAPLMFYVLGTAMVLMALAHYGVL